MTNINNKLIDRRRFLTIGAKAGAFAYLLSSSASVLAESSSDKQKNDRPNIIWIVAEDLSPDISCYGESLIKTPNLESLAREGIVFDKAFVTCPVCSPCRSAMVTGIYQTTLGTLHHRSQRYSSSVDGNPDYTKSYQLPVKSVPQLFQDAGYYTVNIGKTDYNLPDHNFYDDRKGWAKRKPGQPFFAQWQLKGGKAREAKVSNPVDPSKVKLAPYYPDDAVLKEDWAHYLNSWIETDDQVGQVVDKLKKEGTFDNTVIIFLGDHGISSMRGKQYLYEEGIRIPLIMRLPERYDIARVRKDMVLQLDLGPTCMALAGIEIPDYIQGKDIFADDYKPREYIVSARDRCGEPIDTIRSVRTDRYKYIRNFMSFRPHSQRDQYKDSADTIRELRKLNAEGKLNELQSRFFTPTRPPEELYDLEKDPYETVNLAGNKDYLDLLLKLRKTLYTWMVDSRDMGLIPEPILEDMGMKYGDKYFILQDKENSGLVQNLIEVMEAGELKDIKKLRDSLKNGNVSVKYWAAKWLGLLQDKESVDELKKLASSDVPAIRISAALSLCKLGYADEYLPKLLPEIEDHNHLVQMYAMNAIEETGILNDAVKKAAEMALKSKYDNTNRYGRRFLTKFGVPCKYYNEYKPEEYKYLYQPYKQALAYSKGDYGKSKG